MAGIAPGKKGTFHTEHGDVPCWVVEYEAGRDGGDHLVGGFSLDAMRETSGDTFLRWSVVGDEEGAFTPA